MTKHSRRHRRHRQTRRHRKHQRGAGWGFSGPAGVAAGGVPYESRAFVSDCTPMRDSQAVSVGAYPGQQGGACGSCSAPSTLFQQAQAQKGGGGGTGGYGFVLNNDMGKVYGNISTGSCPPPATASPMAQSGGGATDADLYGLVSYKAGYGLTVPVQVNGQSYMDPKPYGSNCMGGGARRKSRRNRRKSRKVRKSRRHH